jgi:Fibronectin type III-like domain
VQVYVHQADGATVFRPEQELRDFDKVLLQPNETKQVHFTLHTNAFSFYDIGHHDWIVEPRGVFEIRLSASSRNVQLRQTIRFTTGRSASALAQSSYPPQQHQHRDHDSMVVDDATFIKRFGANLTAGFEYSLQTRGSRARFHRNSLLKQVADNRIVGRVLLWSVYKASLHQTSAGSGKMTHRQKVLVKAAVENLPLRALVLFSKRALSFEMLDVLIALFNYQVWRAIKCFCIWVVSPFRNK